MALMASDHAGPVNLGNPVEHTIEGEAVGRLVVGCSLSLALNMHSLVIRRMIYLFSYHGTGHYYIL